MTTAKLPSYIVVRPSGLHFRIKVPPDIRTFVGKTELRRTLTSLSSRSAQREAQRLAAIAKEYFDSIRQSQKRCPQGSTDFWEEQPVRQSELKQFRSEEISEAVIPTLSNMINAYSDEQVQGGNWSPKTEQENKAIFALLIRVIGNFPCRELSYSILRKYKTTLIRLPANLNKSPAYRGKTIAEVVIMNCRPMSVTNMNKSLSRVSSLLRWSVKNGFIQTNFAEGLQIKRTTRSDEERSPYTAEQLIQVFKHPLFKQHKYKHPFQYWLPLLGLYTGARLNELCQLHLEDIGMIDNIWVISINADTPDKKLKTLSAARTIPLHSKLQSLGFLTYIESQGRSGSTRVFPELKLARDGYAQKASKWFGQFRKSLMLSNGESKGPDFHSFRHNVSMSLRQNGHSLDEIGELLGHANTAITARYTKRLTVPQLQVIVESLEFTIAI